MFVYVCVCWCVISFMCFFSLPNPPLWKSREKCISANPCLVVESHRGEETREARLVSAAQTRAQRYCKRDTGAQRKLERFRATQHFKKTLKYLARGQPQFLKKNSTLLVGRGVGLRAQKLWTKIVWTKWRFLLLTEKHYLQIFMHFIADTDTEKYYFQTIFTMNLSCAREQPQFLKKRFENAWANEILNVGPPWIPGIAPGVAERIEVFVLLKSWDAIPRIEFRIPRMEFRIPRAVPRTPWNSPRAPRMAFSLRERFSWNWGVPKLLKISLNISRFLLQTPNISESR